MNCAMKNPFQTEIEILIWRKNCEEPTAQPHQPKGVWGEKIKKRVFDLEENSWFYR